MDPFKLATWWVGMCLGIPMLATELAAEVWGTKPKSAPVPVEPAPTADISDAGWARIVEDIHSIKADPHLWCPSEPVVLEPGRIEELPRGFIVHRDTLPHDLPVYLSAHDLPPASAEVEAETYLPGARVSSLDEVRDEVAVLEAVEQVKSDNIITRLKGKEKLARVNARRASRKGDLTWLTCATP